MSGLGPRATAAVAATRVVNAVSRRLGVGSGTVIGGRAGLAVDAGLLGRLAANLDVALVSGTNGKTTTTRLLAVAIETELGPVATNATGSNMPPGHVAALVEAPGAASAVLEVDEGYLPRVVESAGPVVVVLLNLSRDQLDRTNEVRMVAGRWRQALAGPLTTVVANCDDPLVAWAAGTAERVVWVAAGLSWRADAVGCPACEGRIVFADDGWACQCGFARPIPDVWLEEGRARFPGDRAVPLHLQLPGRFNRANAAMAAAGAEALGVSAEEALRRMATVGEVAGRFGVHDVAGRATRLMLAKNPAGWRELLDLVCPGDGPLVIGINARVADGRDPSWLWDVPFERLRGRPVVSTGERCLDLSVRLRYAEVEHQTVRDPVAAVRAAAQVAEAAGTAGGPGRGAVGGPGGGATDGPGTAAGATVEFIGNYTAFHDLLAYR